MNALLILQDKLSQSDRQLEQLKNMLRWVYGILNESQQAAYIAKQTDIFGE